MGSRSTFETVVFVLVVLAFLFTIFVILRSLMHFNKRTRNIAVKMNRAASEEEYIYWHTMLRCQYLRLIPFVTSRNVMKIHDSLFRKPANCKKEKRSDGLIHVLAPSALGICICAVCLCGASWAWFNGTVQSSTAAVRSATFNVDVEVSEGDEPAVPLVLDENKKYTVTLNANTSYTFILSKAKDSTSSIGYCQLTLTADGETAGTLYYTDSVDKDYKIYITPSQKSKLTVEPEWGDVNQRMPGESVLQNGGTIGKKQSAAAQAAKTVSQSSVGKNQSTESTAVASAKSDNSTASSSVGSEKTAQTSSVSEYDETKQTQSADATSSEQSDDDSVNSADTASYGE